MALIEAMFIVVSSAYSPRLELAAAEFMSFTKTTKSKDPGLYGTLWDANCRKIRMSQNSINVHLLRLVS